MHAFLAIPSLVCSRFPAPALSQNMSRYSQLLAAMNNTNSGPDIPASTIYRNVLNPSKVMSFEVLSAQQTTENVYPLMLRFSASGSIVRMKCGMGSPACSSTCNPAADLPISCNNKITPHLHHDYDMVPTFFTVIQSHMAIDCGPHNNDGVQIPSAISIGTKVCTFTSTRFTPGTTSKNSVPLRRTIVQRTTQWIHATFRDRLGLLLGLCHISIPAVCLAFQYLCLPPYHPTPTSGYTSRLSTASWYW